MYAVIKFFCATTPAGHSHSTEPNRDDLLHNRAGVAETRAEEY